MAQVERRSTTQTSPSKSPQQGTLAEAAASKATQGGAQVQDSPSLASQRGEGEDEGESPPRPPAGGPKSKDEDTKGKKTGKDKDGKPKREYLGWEDADDVESRLFMEYMGYQNWKTKFGPGSEWWDRYEKWICSGMTRGVMRKPSLRSLEWLQYQRGVETPPVGESTTRRRCSFKDYFVEPTDNYCCRPCPWPKTTSGEVGWLAQHQSCQLEIYPNDFMKKPPLPWYHRKISTLMPGNM